MSKSQKNVLGESLELCSKDPMTGFLRDGCCNTNTFDRGSHTVCAVVTNEFLEFSKSIGNDLSTPIPELDFKGLAEGDSWCLCADRWLEAYQNNKKVTYKIVGEDEADLKKGKLSVTSPISRSLVGKSEGDVVTIKTPSGNIEYEIYEVKYV